jgi:hypothetical protein
MNDFITVFARTVYGNLGKNELRESATSQDVCKLQAGVFPRTYQRTIILL